jgi:hypothetical protein
MVGAMYCYCFVLQEVSVLSLYVLELQDYAPYWVVTKKQKSLCNFI